MTVRVGIVGLGAAADRLHLPACRAIDEIEVVGGCDPDETARRRLAGTRPGLPTFATTAEMLHAVQPDLVVVGTPPASHYEACREALEAGAHVLCEKPFMASLDEADRIIDLARRRNAVLRVNNQYRFMRFYRETFDRLQRGEFGRLFYIQAWQQMFHPPERETNWRAELSRYVLYEFGTHAFDLASFFFGALPVSVNAHAPRCRPEYASDVVVNLTLRYPEERLAAFSFNRVSHAPERYFEMRLDCEQASIRLSLGGVARFSVDWSRAVGRPVIRVGLARGGQARAEARGKSRVLASSRRPEFASATADHLRACLADIRQPTRSLAAAEHAREMLRLVFAGYDSAASGETVWLRRDSGSSAG